MKHRYIVTLAALVIIWASFKIISSVALHVDPAPHRPTYTAPLIPECDAPLWERIKDRCKGEDQ
jgi:hypothetical protein